MLATKPSDTAEDLDLHPHRYCHPRPLPLGQSDRDTGIASCLAAFAPLIHDARDRLRGSICNLARRFQCAFDPALIEESFVSSLRDSLVQMTARAMVLELNVARLEGLLPGNTPSDRFMAFVKRLQDRAFAEQRLAEYPVLSNEVRRRLNRWVNFSLEFLEHFCDDLKTICNTFFKEDPGLLMSAQGGAGDTHRGGRCVMILTFANGGRVVYKPRSLAVERHFQELLLWLNAHGAEPAFRPLRILDRSTHGWAEFADAVPCANAMEADRFYQRQGGYLGLLYALEASDLHSENLIACGEHPMLVDLEALFHHRPELASSGLADELAEAALSNSALRVGLLPMRVGANGDSAGIDISGLGGAAGQLTPHAVLQWERLDTDEMHFVRKRVPIPGAKNRPTLDLRPLDPADYTESILKGFADMYRLLLRNRGEMRALLHSFATDEVRVIVRPTQTYAVMLHESFHPDLLRCEADRLAFLDRLQEGIGARPALAALVEYERRDLIAGDIPIFTTRPASRDLFTSTGEAVPNYFNESGISLVERRIDGLREKDLERQMWVIRASLSTIATSHPSEYVRERRSGGSSPGRGTATTGQLISAARAVGDRLVELAFDGRDASAPGAAWIGVVPTTERNWHLSPLATDLYDGLPGVVLFLGYLGSITGERRYAALGEHALASVRRQIERTRDTMAIGGFSGWGGIIYTLAHLGVIWRDPTMFLEAESLLNGLPELIERDNLFDVIGGSAGLALALRSLARCRPSAHILEIVGACGEHLIRSAQPAERGVSWLCGSQEASMLTGFAHGNAGIGYALLTIAEMTGEMRFKDAALSAFEYERSLFSSEHENWPDLRDRSKTEFATAWCHGAPGIALSRLSALGQLDDPQLPNEIEIALKTTLKAGFGGNHTLCHGDLGNAEILFCAAETLRQPGWRNLADKIMGNILHEENHWICGNPLGVESPGLMTGIAGIGYAFLRFADPAGIPSVLSLQPPVSLNGVE